MIEPLPIVKRQHVYPWARRALRNQAVTGTRLQRLAKLPRVPTTRDTGTPVKAVQGADREETSLGSFTSRALQYRRELHWDYARVLYGSSRAGRRVFFVFVFSLQCSVRFHTKTNKQKEYIRYSL